MTFSRPHIFFEGEYTIVDLEEFQKTHSVRRVVDIFAQQKKELSDISHPENIGNLKEESSLKNEPEMICGNWVYFPWSELFLHTVSESELFLLRTNRNQYLITKEEQERIRNFSFGVVGLSIGSTIAQNLVYSGMAKCLHLAEYDTLETVNLNRLTARLADIGRPKIVVTMEKIYELDPYAEIFALPDGLTPQSLPLFFEQEKRPQLIFEAVDDFRMKILVRQKALEYRVPVVMMTNLGDSVLIDIERFDREPERPLFHGLVGAFEDKMISEELTPAEKNALAVALVGADLVPERAKQSVRDIGKILVGRPQLMTTVSISGGVAGYIARKIALGEPLSSGRYRMTLESIFAQKII